MTNNFRIEKDSLGKIKVPSGKYWGAQTQRSLENFKIGLDKIPIELIHAFAIQKKASAISNLAIGKLNEKIGKKIILVCDEILDNKFNDQFPLSVWQTGSGTQTNMNLNEVIANRANEILNRKLGSMSPIHPNDHCNMSQSSNDSFPTAIHISIALTTNRKLLPTIQKFIKELSNKEKSFKSIIKIGRTHFQDATPLSLGQEFGCFKSQISNCFERILKALEEVYFLAQGGTAVGTGLNASEEFSIGFIESLKKITNLPFRKSPNFFESLSSHESLVNFSGALNTLVTSCYKICNDLRFLSSGPRCGIAEIELPSNEPGSSIMPGKVNPTQCESMAQVCIYLFGLHNSISFAGSQGNLQLNTNKTVIAFLIINTINLLNDSIASFTEKCLIGLKAKEENIKKNLNNSLMLVTALNQKIGYEKAAEISRKAFKENLTLKDAAEKLNYISAEEFELIVKPEKMIKPS